jgi:hypothetical protein
MPEPNEDERGGKPVLSYRAAMAAYAVLGVMCAATLHGDPLYICLLIIGALAFKTWLARAKSRLE